MLSSLAACGGGGDTPAPDAPAAKDVGFNKPTAPLKANMEVSEDSWMEIGPADMACLGTANADVATTVEVALSTVVRDFQSDNLVPGAMVTAFLDQDVTVPFDTQTADGNAALTITIPVGTKRFGYKMVDGTALDTLLLNQKVDPDNAMQTEASIRSVSKSTAQTLPALIGISRTQGTGVLAGALRDCSDRETSNFIATVTTAPARSYDEANSTRVNGADTYYFSSSVGLPVRHTQKAAASEDGLFMIVEIDPAPTAFVQVWGYIDDAALAADDLTLIAELETASVADTVITGSYEPLRQ
jgi:hypothetical protein